MRKTTPPQKHMLWLSFVILRAARSLASEDEFAGWRMVDRFAGFRYEIVGPSFHRGIQQKADELACFGWVQDTERGTMVGEGRCAKAVGPVFKEWLGTLGDMAIYDYPDTKIKLHFSHFKILTQDRKTCFPEPPHQCSNSTHFAAAPEGKKKEEL